MRALGRHRPYVTLKKLCIAIVVYYHYVNDMYPTYNESKHQTAHELVQCNTIRLPPASSKFPHLCCFNITGQNLSSLFPHHHNPHIAIISQSLNYSKPPTNELQNAFRLVNEFHVLTLHPENRKSCQEGRFSSTHWSHG